MSRIIELHEENVKKLRAVTIRPGGNMVVIGGPNGAGKSSVLDGIAWALGGKDEISEVPVRRGEESARVVMRMEDMVIERTFTAAGGTKLVVRDLRGKKQPSPQSVLDRLTSKRAFDPLEFMRMEQKTRAAALRAAVGLDFKSLDAERQRLFDERTAINRDLEQAKALVSTKPFHPDAPDEAVSAANIFQQIETAQAHNASAQELVRVANGLDADVGQARVAKTTLEAEIADLERKLQAKRAALQAQETKIADLVAKAQHARVAAEAVALIPTEPLRARLSGIEETNRQVRDNQEHREAKARVAEKQAASESLTARIAAIDAEKQRQLEAVPFPVPGLSVTERGVTLDGLPFEQASTAAQLRVSVAIAAAMNPKMRVMLVRDGAFLDESSLALLDRLAEEHNLQVWIERVGVDEHCSFIIEDGELRGGSEPPATTAEPAEAPPVDQDVAEEIPVAAQ